MKIIHIGSFTGNIGDSISHIGLTNILMELAGPYTKENVEIRRFYRNYDLPDKGRFDNDFIDYINKFDLVIIGGGGFLDYWVPGSVTGTTIDMEPRLVERIKTRTLISSVGCHPHRSIPAGNEERCRKFIDSLLSNNNIRVAVRNDGSIGVIERVFGKHYSNAVVEILDNGFFYVQRDNLNLPFKRPYIAINITNDQLDMLSSDGSRVDVGNYYKELTFLINEVVSDFGFDILLVPHIYKDVLAISRLLSELNETLVREHVVIAPYIQGELGAHLLASLYGSSQVIVATRLHANVVGMAIGVPTIGLAVLDRIDCIHTSVGSTRFVKPVSGFSAEVLTMLRDPWRPRTVEKIMNYKKNKSIDFYRRAIC